MSGMVRYLARVPAKRVVLWIALLWHGVVAFRHGDAGLAAWTTALGMAVIVGTLLTINAIPAGGTLRSLAPWAVFRFFLIPFCVSSFSALVKGKGFWLIFPARLEDNLLPVGVCAAFCGLVGVARFLPQQGERARHNSPNP